MMSERYKKQIQMVLSNLMYMTIIASLIAMILNFLNAHYILVFLLILYVVVSLVLLKNLERVINSPYKDEILLVYSSLLLSGIVVDFIQNGDNRLEYVWILLIPFTGYMVNGLRYQVFVTAIFNAIILAIYCFKYPPSHSSQYYLEFFYLLLVMAVFWAIAYHYERMKYHLIDKLDKTITVDPLTKLNNREQLYNIYSQYKDQIMTLILIDVKGIKEINDQYGYLAGDVSLINVAQSLMDSKVENSHTFRFGDDEFAILVAGKDSDTCLPLVRELYAKVASNKTIFKNEVMNTTISMGVASIESDGKNLDKLMQKASKLLKQAKQAKNDKIAI